MSKRSTRARAEQKSTMEHATCIVVFALITVLLYPVPFLLAAQIPGTGDDAGKTVVYRDTWGVPHIYAPTYEAGAYAIGWAQAQDRPEELLKNFMRAIAENAP